MKDFTQEGMFDKLSKISREVNKSKFEKMNLPKFVLGGSNSCPEGLVWDEKLQDCVKIGRELEPSVITPVTMHIAKYEEQNPYDDFFAKKKAQYIKRAGNFGKITNLETNFPDNQIKKIKDEYEYNRNNYVADKLGYDYNDREKWIDKLSPAAREVLQNSEYASKLQPSLWAKTNAGLRALGNTLLPGQPISYDVKGLSPKEEAEYKKDKFAAFDATAFADVPGAVVFNALADARPYAKNPGVLSGEVVNEAGEMGAGLLNPLMPIEMGTGVSLAPDLVELGLDATKGAYKLGTKAYNAATNLGPVQTVTNTVTNAAQRLNLPEVGTLIKDVITPGSVKNIKNKITNINQELNSLSKESNTLHNAANTINNKVLDLEWKLRGLTENANLSDKNKYEIIKLKNEINKLNTAKEELNLKLENDKLITQNIDVYQKLGTMKSELGDGTNHLIDFETGNKVPIEITTPGVREEISIVNGKPVKRQLENDGDYGFNPAYAETQNKNIEFVKKTLPGSKPYGSSVLHNIGVAHASNDIDVAMTASDWNKVKNNVTVSTDKQAKYGPTINLGDQFGAQGNIDVNIIGENPTTGLAEGNFAKELYRQFFPDEFYKESQSLIEGNLGKNTSELGDIKINKTAKELMDAYDPEVKSILDAYEITPETRTGFSPSKVKHINRIDYILENATDYDKVAKAQELFAKSLAGSKASIGQQFAPSQLSDISQNLNLLTKMGLVGTNHNAIKIALDPKKMQLFLNDFYINKSVYTRQIELNPEFINKPEDLVNAYTNWKAIGASNMGMGTNAVELGSPRFFNRDEHITGNIHYNLTKGKAYTSPAEYVDDILSQTSGARKFNDNEKKIILDLAQSHNIPIKKGMEPETLGDLLDDNRYMMIDEQSRRNKAGYDSDFVDSVNNFYKDAAKVLGAKAVQKGIFGDQNYATLLNDFDKEFDALTIAYNKDIPYVKSRHDRIANLQNQKPNSNVKINEKDYYKIKYYLEGGIEEVEKKLREAEDFRKAFEQKMKDKAYQKIGGKEQHDSLKKQKEDITIKIKQLGELLDKLHDRTVKIQNVRGISSAIGISTGVIGGGYNAITNHREDAIDEAEFTLDLIKEKEDRVGKLSEKDEIRKKRLITFLKNVKK